MADTKALRAKIEAKIKRLQDQLRAIETVEQLSLELDSEASSQPRGLPSKILDRALAAEVATISATVLEALTSDWRTTLEVYQNTRKVHPHVSVGAVRTALRRWKKRGYAEPKGTKATGLKWRTKEPTEIRLDKSLGA